MRADWTHRDEHITQALARLEAEWPGKLLLVTQNVDDLHERAGSRRVLHMHGEHLNAWCTSCDIRSRWTGPLIASGRAACETRRLIRQTMAPALHEQLAAEQASLVGLAASPLVVGRLKKALGL